MPAAGDVPRATYLLRMVITAVSMCVCVRAIIRSATRSASAAPAAAGAAPPVSALAPFAVLRGLGRAGQVAGHSRWVASKPPPRFSDPPKFLRNLALEPRGFVVQIRAIKRIERINAIESTTPSRRGSHFSRRSRP